MRSHLSTKTLKLAPVLALLAVALPATAYGQATRTWVSGTGDDVNPCSRTAPCKTLPGAISKTAEGGEINGIDGGGFGTVTINKSITIDLEGTWEPGILVAGGVNGINVNAGTDDVVILRGLDIYSPAGGTTTPGLNGIKVTSARAVKVQNSRIHGFSHNGIEFAPNANPERLSVTNTAINHNGGNGVLVDPGSAGNANVTLRRNDIEDNACGVASTRFGPDPAFAYGTFCGTATSASGVTGTAAVSMYHNSLSDNTGLGVMSRGTTSTVRLGNNDENGSFVGAQAVDSGILQTWGNNEFVGNGSANITGATPLGFSKIKSRKKK